MNYLPTMKFFVIFTFIYPYLEILILVIFSLHGLSTNYLMVFDSF